MAEKIIMNETEQKRESAFLMSGTEALARGAWEAGVKVACAYRDPLRNGILDSLAEYPEVDCEWSSNEKVALEVSSGASLAGARALAAMTHIGLNLAADPFFSVSYMGVNAGLVIASTDDPGMHFSQNEQDSRSIVRSARMAMLEPSSQQEAKDYTIAAFEISEQFDTPVMIRTTTALNHGRSKVWQGKRYAKPNRPYYKNPVKNVALPAHGRIHHRQIEIERIPALERESEKYAEIIEGSDDLAFITSGIPFLYVREAFPRASVLKLGMTYPLPRKIISHFAYRKKRIIVVEELQPYLEEQICALGIACEGKSCFPMYGEISPSLIMEAFDESAGNFNSREFTSIPPRPPTLCAGCIHCGILYVLHQLGTIASGDIGCYTCAARPPLSAMDCCMNMGASIGMAHGMGKVLTEAQKRRTVAVIDDSTFYHSGVNGLINLLRNGDFLTVVILRSLPAGMKSCQEPPTAKSIASPNHSDMTDLASLCRGIGIEHVRHVDPYDLLSIWRVLDEELHRNALSVVIADGSCIPKERHSSKAKIKVSPELCTGCFECTQLACPAIEMCNGYPSINRYLCIGCTNCQQVCATCNAGIDITSVLELVQRDRYDEAVKTVLRANPFPAVSSRICQQPCNSEFNALGLEMARSYAEKHPVLAKKFPGPDRPSCLSVSDVLKFLGDYSLNTFTGPEFKPVVEREEKVAIIGAGPAGLSAAWYLRQNGFQVDVFESQPKPGGMLRYGIPRFQLPHEILSKEVDRIGKTGIHIQCRFAVGQDITFPELLMLFDAAIVAVGRSKPRELALEGMSRMDGRLLDGNEFLQRFNEDEIGQVRDVVVIGGGNTAVDCARAARRLGAHVTVCYRKRRSDMSADKNRIMEALGEGVHFEFQATPVRIFKKNGRGCVIEFIRTKHGMYEKSGREVHLPTTKRKFEVSAELVISAIGKNSDLKFMGSLAELSYRFTGESANPKVFACGDVAFPKNSVIQAIASGRKVAETVAERLMGRDPV
jgi:indolepyruvate ferredoxin oxidoreductase alpha subunit